MWAGYAFSVDFVKSAAMPGCSTTTLHQARPRLKQPGTPNCHASTYTIMKKLGEGDL
jgi:hypothetical protein